MVGLLTLENQILHQIQYFFVVFLMSAPITDAVQIHVTRSSFCDKQTCMMNQFVVTLFFFNWSNYDSDEAGFSYVNVHMQKQSLFHAHKDIRKELNYYGLLYKCVSRHFIINWNLTS